MEGAKQSRLTAGPSGQRARNTPTPPEAGARPEKDYLIYLNSAPSSSYISIIISAASLHDLFRA